MARSIWKGHVKFGMVLFPACLYPSIEASEKVSLNQLHKTDSGPIGYDKKCKVCGEICTKDSIVKGYKAGDGHVIITDDEIAAIRVPSTKVIDIQTFVDAQEISPLWYDTPYFIGPDSDVANEPYALLVAGLKTTEKVGVGKLSLRDREHLIAITPLDEGLVLYTLRYPAEMRTLNDVKGLAKLKEPPKEATILAKTLIEQMSGDLGEIDMVDGYNVSLRAMIEDKIAGRAVAVTPIVEPVRPAIDIMSALKASIAQSAKPDKAEPKPKAKVQAATKKGKK